MIYITHLTIPPMKACYGIGRKGNIESALGMCAFYDCIIQHGDGDTVAIFSPEHSGTEKDQRGYPLCLKSQIFILITVFK